MRKHSKSTALLPLLLTILLLVSIAAPVHAAMVETSIPVEYTGIVLRFNGKDIDNDEVLPKGTNPFISRGVTYLPLRAVANIIGMDVDWSAPNRINISDPAITVLGLEPVAADGDFGAYLWLLKQIADIDMQPFNGLPATAANVAAAANAATGLTELAAALEANGNANGAISAATAAGLLPDAYGDGAFTAAQLNDVAFRVAGANGLARGYVGRLSDEDILSKLDVAWRTIPDVLNEDMKAIGGAILDSGVITGFNIRNTAYSIAFNPARSLLYSHSSLKHVKQLVALAKSLGYDARIALEPKTSWYYWEGLSYDQEYDVHFEFASAADKAKFDGLVKTYAQRADTMDGLLSGSWRAPLYASGVAVDENYVEIVNNTFYFPGTNYYVVSYGLKGASSDIVIDAFAAKGAKVDQSPIFVNTAFYQYLVDNLPEALADAS